MVSWKRLARSRFVQAAVGAIGAEYIRLVFKTSRFIVEPPDIYERIAPDLPIILAMWHGQHFLSPFIKRPEHRAKVLISRHRDGEVNAIAAQRLGIGVIRGSGDNGVEFHRKGGVPAFREMLAALEDGYNMALTADVPKISRVAGRGIVKLAALSGRPIYPIAIATRRRIELDNWDRSVINLPFSRGGAVVPEPIVVPPGADEATLESCRSQLEVALNAATARAYALADG